MGSNSVVKSRTLKIVGCAFLAILLVGLAIAHSISSKIKLEKNDILELNSLSFILNSIKFDDQRARNLAAAALRDKLIWCDNTSVFLKQMKNLRWMQSMDMAANLLKKDPVVLPVANDGVIVGLLGSNGLKELRAIEEEKNRKAQEIILRYATFVKPR